MVAPAAVRTADMLGSGALSGLVPIGWLSYTMCGCPPGACASPLPMGEGTNLSDKQTGSARLRPGQARSTGHLGMSMA
ncbi:uncharacterized protein STAUR_4344 [Stigmatella aurantiaca DW4/3-1]|uniref:Uncharacterized protein n=1 Tax=Stigmatella aurantiaca (strain DW4/3-1) TaxID=378806 RepID=E3FTY4_STIAD|nr:uncharacterized protein STAUR_4344 [Stigmatella aurantiaca DW4/3-1]